MKLRCTLYGGGLRELREDEDLDGVPYKFYSYFYLAICNNLIKTFIISSSLQPKTDRLLNVLINNDIDSKDKLIKMWKKQPTCKYKNM